MHVQYDLKKMSNSQFRNMMTVIFEFVVTIYFAVDSSTVQLAWYFVPFGGKVLTAAKYGWLSRFRTGLPKSILT